jgi:hypothetical protein
MSSRVLGHVDTRVADASKSAGTRLGLTYSSHRGALSHLDEFLEDVYNVRETSFLFVKLMAPMDVQCLCFT